MAPPGHGMWSVGVTVSVYTLTHTHTQNPAASLALGQDRVCQSR